MFLEFVEGPLWYLASVIFVAGVILRLVDVLVKGVKTDLSVQRCDGTAGALRTIITRSWTATGFTKGATFHLVAGYMFHIGLFILLLWAAPRVFSL